MNVHVAIRVRGGVKAPQRTVDTLDMLGLKEPNNCVLVQDSPGFHGMLQLCKDYITWGEPTPQVLSYALKRWARVGSRKPTSEEWKKVGGWEGLAKLLLEGKTLRELGFNKTLRLHPPRGGYKSVKRPVGMKGDLGYRGDKISLLLERMS